MFAMTAVPPNPHLAFHAEHTRIHALITLIGHAHIMRHVALDASPQNFNTLVLRRTNHNSPHSTPRTTLSSFFVARSVQMLGAPSGSRLVNHRSRGSGMQ